MVKEVTMEQEIKLWKTFAAKLEKGGRRFMMRTLGEFARFAHNKTAYRYLRLGPKISPMTNQLRKVDGIGSRRSGNATGRLANQVGTPAKGTATGLGSLGGISTRLQGLPKAIRFNGRGFTIGEGYADYTKHLEKGWGPLKYTPRQAAFLTHKLQLSPAYAKGLNKRRKAELADIGKKSKTGKVSAKRKRSINDKYKKLKAGTLFDYALFKGLLKGTHKAPPRPFNYLTLDDLKKGDFIVAAALMDVSLDPIR